MGPLKVQSHAGGRGRYASEQHLGHLSRLQHQHLIEPIMFHYTRIQEHSLLEKFQRKTKGPSALHSPSPDPTCHGRVKKRRPGLDSQRRHPDSGRGDRKLGIQQRAPRPPGQHPPGRFSRPPAPSFLKWNPAPPPALRPPGKRLRPPPPPPGVSWRATRRFRRESRLPLPLSLLASSLPTIPLQVLEGSPKNGVGAAIRLPRFSNSPRLRLPRPRK